ncbi:MAG: AI-2E family transporter [Motiliproteus sp.]
MNQSLQDGQDQTLERNVINITAKLAVLLLLFFWCFNIIRPFIIPVVWGAVIAVSLYPVYSIILPKLKNNGKITGTVFTLALLAMLLVPVIMLSGSVVDIVQSLHTSLEENTLKVPVPSTDVKEWPLIGDKLYAAWHLASVNIDGAIVKYTPQIKSITSSLLSSILSGGKGIVQFIISIIIASVLMVNAVMCVKSTEKFLIKLSPQQGEKFANLASKTIRSVAQGVIGIGIVQATFLGLGFWAIGVPGAGLWALIILVLSIAQLPPLIVILPVIIYVFSLDDISNVALIIFTIWSLFGGIMDGLLKPFVMGRGVDAPMLIILIGAIGGMILDGILGLFTGAIVLALGYIILAQWVNESSDSQQIKTAAKNQTT